MDNPKNFIFLAIDRDKAHIWLNGIKSSDSCVTVRPPIEMDHRHKRTGQFQRGHDTAHRFPEYFEDIAKYLVSDKGILIISHGRGNSSYGYLLLKYLESKHRTIFENVLENITLDISNLSESEIKACARQWFEREFQILTTRKNR